MQLCKPKRFREIQIILVLVLPFHCEACCQSGIVHFRHALEKVCFIYHFRYHIYLFYNQRSPDTPFSVQNCFSVKYCLH